MDISERIKKTFAGLGWQVEANFNAGKYFLSDWKYLPNNKNLLEEQGYKVKKFTPLTNKETQAIINKIIPGAVVKDELGMTIVTPKGDIAKEIAGKEKVKSQKELQASIKRGREIISQYSFDSIPEKDESIRSLVVSAIRDIKEITDLETKEKDNESLRELREERAKMQKYLGSLQSKLSKNQSDRVAKIAKLVGSIKTYVTSMKSDRDAVPKEKLSQYDLLTSKLSQIEDKLKLSPDDNLIREAESIFAQKKNFVMDRTKLRQKNEADMLAKKVNKMGLGKFGPKK